MKKKNGFTLVELLAVIVLLALLMTIAIPAALSMSQKVKEKSYSTKIDLINNAGKNYGNTNKNLVRKGLNLEDNKNYTCKFTFDDDGKVKSIVYAPYTGGAYSEVLELPKNEYWCIRKTIQDLADSNDLDYDEKDACKTSVNPCSDSELQHYNDIVLDPTNNYVINSCYVYIYYKFNRVYATFDREKCSDCKNGACDSYNETGHEYRQK